MIEAIIVIAFIAVMVIIALNPKEGKRTGRDEGKRVERGRDAGRGGRRSHEPKYLGAEQAERDAIITLTPKEGKRTGRGKGKRFERGRRRWHEPEYLGAEQAERDARAPGREFHVYILETELGHYIGHTGRLEQRLEDHIYGYVRSTKGADPRPLWKSKPMDSRNDAARFEAAMKSYRDSRAPRYREITGHAPVPWL